VHCFESVQSVTGGYDVIDAKEKVTGVEVRVAWRISEAVLVVVVVVVEEMAAWCPV
jgi:hypothetical protein